MGRYNVGLWRPIAGKLELVQLRKVVRLKTFHVTNDRTVSGLRRFLYGKLVLGCIIIHYPEDWKVRNWHLQPVYGSSDSFLYEKK